MPKLMVFAVCEKVIISNDNTTSLITLLEDVHLNVPDSEELPSDANIPFGWHIFALWIKEPTDEGKKLEQHFEVLMPGGNHNISRVVPFEFPPNQLRYRMIVNLVGFPIVPAGICHVKVSIREAGANDWILTGEYPIVVDRVSA